MIDTGKDIAYAARCLREGKLVAFPTETVYGLGANALDPVAVSRIFEVKKRPAFDPLIVHLSSVDDLPSVLRSPIDDRVFLLAGAFWPGPLTIVATKKSKVPGIVTSGLPGVGVRVPSHPVARELIRLAGVPVAAPSANLFGQLSPTRAHHVAKQLSGVDYLLDGGETGVGIESTVVSVQGDRVELLRPGAITLEDLQSVIPGVIDKTRRDSEEENLPSPGMLQSHYSPSKPLYLCTPGTIIPPVGSGYIAASAHSPVVQCSARVNLSGNGDLLEIASRLFEALHAMEEEPGVTSIYIDTVEEKGIGIAIMDRLKKASHRYGRG